MLGVKNSITSLYGIFSGVVKLCGKKLELNIFLLWESEWFKVVISVNLLEMGLKSFQSSVAFHIETSQLTGFYMKHNTRLI